MQGGEDKFGGGKLGDVREEERFPWGRREGEVVSCCRHGVKERAEADGRWRSYGWLREVRKWLVMGTIRSQL